MKFGKDAACNHSQSDGFALVVTVSLMILLSVVAVGLLGLSAISLRSGAQEKAASEARANARLALALAIGELQNQLGPDQRISAKGAITATSGVRHPHLTGAWDSWIAGPKTDAPVNAGYGPTRNRDVSRRLPASWR